MFIYIDFENFENFRPIMFIYIDFRSNLEVASKIFDFACSYIYIKRGSAPVSRLPRDLNLRKETEIARVNVTDSLSDGSAK